jgi:hypothetical protein
MSLSFLDEYWNIVDCEKRTQEQAIKRNKHFDPLTNFLLKINNSGVPEDKIPVRYRPWKKWDLHFPLQNIAIEYKSITSKSIQKAKYFRIEEALGSAIDLKKQNDNYRLGFLLVFAFPFENVNIIKSRDYMISAFDNMVNDGIYDFFCPLQTTSMGNHWELSNKNTFANFIKECNFK